MQMIINLGNLLKTGCLADVGAYFVCKVSDFREKSLGWLEL